MVIQLPLSRCSCTAAGHDYSAVWWPVVIDDDGFFDSTLVLYLHVQAFAMCQSDLKMLVFAVNVGNVEVPRTMLHPEATFHEFA